MRRFGERVIGRASADQDGEASHMGQPRESWMTRPHHPPHRPPRGCRAGPPVAATEAPGQPTGEAVMAWQSRSRRPGSTRPRALSQITPFGILFALHDALVRPLPNQKMGNSLAESWTESPDGLVTSSSCAEAQVPQRRCPTAEA